MPAVARQGSSNASEIAAGERFEFGKNWRRFLQALDEDHIAEAERSLREMLELESLAGRRFLDIGSGSGLFSLAARRLGARQVHSFDFDPASVACTNALRQRYFRDDPGWSVEEGSILDEEFVANLGPWDVVYCWGVVHHTGSMWRALELAASTVDEGGLLFISIYNDQGFRSRLWRDIKRSYNRMPPLVRPLFAALVIGPGEVGRFAIHALRGEPLGYLRSWTRYKRARGMSRRHDIVDWLGGYPFEVAQPGKVFDFLHRRGFGLERLITFGGGSACNQYVFSRAR